MSAMRRAGVGASVAALVSVGLTGTAEASDGKIGYRECANRILVYSTTSPHNSSYYVQHSVRRSNVTYYSPRWYTSGYHSYTFGVRGGEWQVYTSGGTMQSGGASCA